MAGFFHLTEVAKKTKRRVNWRNMFIQSYTMRAARVSRATRPAMTMKPELNGIQQQHLFTLN